MPHRCVVHTCGNRSDMKAGISAHLNRAIKSQRDICGRHSNFNPRGNFFPFFLSLQMQNSPNYFVFHDLPRPTLKFHEFPGLEKEGLQFQDFQCFPFPMQTLICVFHNSYFPFPTFNCGYCIRCSYKQEN